MPPLQNFCALLAHILNQREPNTKNFGPAAIFDQYIDLPTICAYVALTHILNQKEPSTKKTGPAAIFDQYIDLPTVCAYLALAHIFKQRGPSIAQKLGLAVITILIIDIFQILCAHLRPERDQRSQKQAFQLITLPYTQYRYFRLDPTFCTHLAHIVDQRGTSIAKNGPFQSI